MNLLALLWPVPHSPSQNLLAAGGTGITEHLGSEIRHSPFTPSSGWVTPTRQTVLAFPPLTVPIAEVIAAYMDFIFERLKHKNPDGSLQIMYTIHGQLLCEPFWVEN